MKKVDRLVAAVEIEIQNVILPAMDSVVIPRSEMAVRSITGSSGCGLNNTVQNLGLKDLSGNKENTSLMTTCSRTHLNINQDRNYETHICENFNDKDFLAFKPNYDWHAHVHYSIVSPIGQQNQKSTW